MKHKHRIELSRSDLMKYLYEKNIFDSRTAEAKVTLGYDGGTQREEVTDDNPLFVEWEDTKE